MTTFFFLITPIQGRKFGCFARGAMESCYGSGLSRTNRQSDRKRFQIDNENNEIRSNRDFSRTPYSPKTNQKLRLKLNILNVLLEISLKSSPYTRNSVQMDTRHISSRDNNRGTNAKRKPYIPCVGVRDGRVSKTAPTSSPGDPSRAG